MTHLYQGRGGVLGGVGGICMPRIDSDIQLVGTNTRNHAGKGNRCKLANGRESDTLLSAVERRRAGAATFAVGAVKKGTEGGVLGGGWRGCLLLATPATRECEDARTRTQAHTRARRNTRAGHTSACFQPREPKESRTDPELHGSAGANPV